MTIETKAHLIGGEWRDSGRYTDNVNPSDTGDIIARYASGTVEDVDDAVAAASAAAPGWRDTTPQQRADLLDRVATALLGRAGEIGRLLSREEGKTLAEGIGEATRAGQIFRFFAGEALRLTGENMASLRAGVDIDVMRDPVGVVGLITPWNYPIAIPAWKTAPALAFGNTVVLKPADLTPGCAHVLAEILVGCGVPPGVFNLVMGSGSRLGAALTAHPDVAAISFTGSRATGDRVLDSARLTLKKVQLEMGGKNPTVVMDDADLDLAVPAVIDAAFHSTGQRCTATSRIVVHRKVHDAFVERLVHAMDALRVGDALDPLTRIGPVVSAAQLDSNLRYVAMAAADGAEVQGGQPVGGKGHFQRPGLFLGARNDMRTSREEIFGPLASVIRVEDFDEALATANDTPFGLAAGIFTTSLRHWRAFRRGARAGVVTVNLATAGLDYHVPFGGTRGSSFGPREQGRHAVEFYTSIKTVYTLAG